MKGARLALRPHKDSGLGWGEGWRNEEDAGYRHWTYGFCSGESAMLVGNLPARAEIIAASPLLPRQALSDAPSTKSDADLPLLALTRRQPCLAFHTRFAPGEPNLPMRTRFAQTQPNPTQPASRTVSNAKREGPACDMHAGPSHAHTGAALHPRRGAICKRIRRKAATGKEATGPDAKSRRDLTGNQTSRRRPHRQA